MNLGLSVWRRNRDVYFVTWKTNLIPPLMEPILYLVAFGAGVGALVSEIRYRGDVVGYTEFIAPGLLATQVMFQAFFENTFNTFVRMHYQRTFEAILATPLSVDQIMVGELLWGATKALLGCALMMLAITGFGLLHYPESLLILPFSLLAGFFFASLALCFTGLVRQIDMFNLPTFLFVMPMFLFAGTFFPLEVLPGWAQALAQFLPLTHVVNAMREMSLGRVTSTSLWDTLYLLLVTPPVTYLGIRLMRRRLIH